MRTFQTQSQAAQRGASNSTVSLLSAASVTLTALLILCIPVCRGAPAEPQQATTDQGQLLSQIDAACSSYLSADRKFRASDVLGELCVSMLVQKLKEQKVTDNSKRFTGKDLLADRLHRKYCHDKNKDCDGSRCRSLKKLQCCVLSCISFLNSTPEEREDSPCTLTSRDLEESRAEVTSSIGHEMEDDPSNMSKIKSRHL